MKFIIFLLVVFSFSLNAQTRNMTKSELARTYSAETLTRTVQPLLQQAEREFRALDYDKAFLTLENAVAQNPASPEALLMRARFLKIVGRDAEAKIDIEQANLINPIAANLYGLNGYNGILQVLAAEPEKAVREQSKMNKLSGYYTALDRELLSYENLNEEIFILEDVIEDLHLKKYDVALLDLDKVLQSHPESPLAHDLRGLIMHQRGQNEEARIAFETAIKNDPDFAMAYYNLAIIEKENGNLKESKAFLTKAIELEENLTKAYFDRAVVNKSLGNRDLALQDYEYVVSNHFSSNYDEAILNRGLTKKMIGDYTGALDDLNSAIESYPNNYKLYKNRGNLNFLFGLHLNAIDDYTSSIKSNPKYAEAYYNRGLTFLLLHDPISACSDLQRSLDLGYNEAKQVMKYFCQ